jgi:hypothetical protein
MKAIAALAVLALALPLFAAAAPASEEAAIRATIEHYLRAHATGDGKHLLQAFRPELHMMFVRDGALQMKTRDEFIAGFSGKPADDEAQRKRSIEMIDVTGNAAVAKLKLDYPKTTLTDYFTLLKIGGEWKVVNKIFHAEPKK